MRVNVLCPGWIETSFGEQVDREFHRSVAEGTPLGRWGRPQDVAERGALPRLARGGVRHRPGDQRQRRRRDVVQRLTPEGGSPWSGPSPSRRTYELDEVEAKLKELGLDDWYLEDGWIRRKYNTDGWPSTLMAVNADRLPVRAGVASRRPVGDLGQALGQAAHARQPAASPTTTSQLARRIEDTVLWRPAEDSTLEGTPNKFVFSKGGR